ncbi:MAG: Flp pilus assembly protein CpaB [Beijerinckiaceae bacterium]
MRGPAVAMVGIAVLIGGGTVIGGRFYLERNNQRAAKTEVAAPAKPLNTTTVVVASMPLRFGMELSSNQLKEVQWPTDAVPAGSVSSVAEFLKGPEKRVVIAAMDANEAILAGKVTGPGERATLSAVIAPGMTAVTVPLSETQGIAGLVMPGDRVNLVFTRTLDKDQSFTDVLLQNIRVVAVDQVIDQRSEKPAAIRSATLEVMPQDAKRVALAGTVGSLSLMLRKAGEISGGAIGRVTAKDLLSGTASDSDTTASHGKRTTTVKVTRSGKTEEYTVLTDKTR